MSRYNNIFKTVWISRYGSVRWRKYVSTTVDKLDGTSISHFSIISLLYCSSVYNISKWQNPTKLIGNKMRYRGAHKIWMHYYIIQNCSKQCVENYKGHIVQVLFYRGSFFFSLDRDRQNFRIRYIYIWEIG